MAEEEEKKELVVAKKPTSKWVLWTVIGIVAVYIILMIIGFAVFHAIGNHNRNAVNGSHMTQMFSRPRYSNQQSYNVQQSNSDGLTTTTTNTTYTQTQGVITAVNSDNIVVAGGGK